MYTANETVRYSDVNSNKLIGMSQIAKYFQDCTLCHSENIGMGFDFLDKTHKAWFLTGWQIVVDRFPTFNEKIQVRTWPYDFKGVYGYRNFDILDEEGKRIAWANSIWLYLNIDTMGPLKATKEDLEAYKLEDRLDMDYQPRKIKLDGESYTEKAFAIKKSDIDSNNHVNNSKYISFAEEYLPDDMDIKQVRVDYKRAATYGETLLPVIYDNGEVFSVELCGEDGKSNVIVEFMRK